MKDSKKENQNFEVAKDQLVNLKTKIVTTQVDKAKRDLSSSKRA